VILESLAAHCGYDIVKDLGSLKLILLSGRVVPPALREYFEKRWNARVSCVYGMTEGGGIASMCHAGRFHIHSNAFILELLNPSTGDPVAPGEIGVLVITNYYRQAAPLVRYNTRDWCRLIPEPCPCGDKHPTLEVLGRMDDTIEFEGKQLYFARIDQAVVEFSQQFGTVVYFVIVTPKRLHIRVESANGLPRPSQESLNKLGAALGVPFKVDVCRAGELLNRDALTKVPNVGKPHTVSDWRGSERRCVSLSEALIEWPHMGIGDVTDLVRRAVSNEILRKTL
jgi:phenylacetate-coenzyme A ligase PaaK-like adenylate-forming protein